MLSMPTSVEGHVAILTAVDTATGFIFCKAMFGQTGKNVTDLLMNSIIPYFGAPNIIVTDLGVENKNLEVSQLLSHFNINNVFSSRAHPQSNGMVERRQQMLLNFARLHSDTLHNQNLWHLLLNSQLPYSVILSKPLNLKEDLEIAGRLLIANQVMDNLEKHFQ